MLNALSRQMVGRMRLEQPVKQILLL